MKSIKIIITGDGSHTLILPNEKESYHSVHGAITESVHVYVKSGLLQLIKNGKKQIRILEVGFGTGLNALLTWEKAKQENLFIDYHCLEPYPLSHEIWSKLNYPDLLGHTGTDTVFYSLHESNWNTKIQIDEEFMFTKHDRPIGQAVLEENYYDLVYFDAFAPQVDPEMWSEHVFSRLYKSMVCNSILTTYSAKGQVKRTLRKVGFIIESLEGPKGKREITRAVKKK